MKKIDYKVFENCEAWTPDNKTPWDDLFVSRVKYSKDDQKPILYHKFHLYRFNKHLTLERSSQVDEFSFLQPNDEWNRLIGPMDGPESPEYKDGTRFALAKGVYSWEFHYQYDDLDKNNFTEGKSCNVELMDIINNSIQEIAQRLLPNKDVQFSTMFEHNDVLVDGAKIAGTLVMSNDTGVWSHGMITWEYDHKLFSKLLPEAQLKRLHRIHGEGKGITGIKNQLPVGSKYTNEDFTRELLETIDRRIKEYRSKINEFKS